ncbi:MAG: TetR/AcrR family transcriptional regulator [Pseudomonadota bacterium]|nr:MAG: TetR family transcriptional regulator [Pseudomonadota bacterium]
MTQARRASLGDTAPRSRKTAARTRQSPWEPSQERARRRELKRDALIRAAARAFRERGYHNTSLDDVAADLGVTKPIVYHYVGNKQQLLFECFRTGVDQIRSAFAELEGSRADGRTRLLAVMRRYAEAICSDFGWCMVRAEDQDLDPELSGRIKALKSEIDQGLRRLIREGIEDGSIRECDPKMTSFAIAGALNWIAHWHRGRDALSPSEIAARFIDVFENGLRPRNER